MRTDSVTALLADDNWGNLMAVLPDDRRKPKAGGIYYHADCKSAFAVLELISRRR
jgi:hypothetical protein